MNKYVYKKYMEIPHEQALVVLSDIHIFQLDLLLIHRQFVFLKGREITEGFKMVPSSSKWPGKAAQKLISDYCPSNANLLLNGH